MPAHDRASRLAAELSAPQNFQAAVVPNHTNRKLGVGLLLAGLLVIGIRAVPAWTDQPGRFTFERFRYMLMSGPVAFIFWIGLALVIAGLVLAVIALATRTQSFAAVSEAYRQRGYTAVGEDIGFVYAENNAAPRRAVLLSHPQVSDADFDRLADYLRAMMADPAVKSNDVKWKLLGGKALVSGAPASVVVPGAPDLLRIFLAPTPLGRGYVVIPGADGTKGRVYLLRGAV